jgi:glycosyltransferase involved in cell wall biosynthesis
MKKLISVVSPTFNEQDNVKDLYARLSAVWEKFPNYDFELIVIDNASTDLTVERLKLIASKDQRLKIIVNNKNYGHLRSPYWGMLQAHGDAVIFLASDMQDPPELIENFIVLWEKGSKIVLGVKPTSNLNGISHSLRKSYYRFLNKMSNIEIVNDATGFGIYDKKVMDLIREINDPNPYFRGLVCELGYPITTIEFKQAKRMRGVTKNNLYSLYDMAMMGFVNYSLIGIIFWNLFRCYQSSYRNGVFYL